MGVLMSDENGNLKRYAGNKLPIGYAGLVTQVNNMKAEIDNKVKKVEVVYNMQSGDSNINWGYTSGIPNATSVPNKDFSKFEYLIAFFDMASTISVAVILNLGNATTNGYYCSTASSAPYQSNNLMHVFGSEIRVNPNKTQVEIYCGVMTNGYQGTQGICRKIIGVY